MRTLRTKMPGWLGLAVWLVASTGVGQETPTEAQDAQAPVSSGITIPLPTIPPPVPTALTPAEPDAIGELGKLLDKLASVQPKERDEAATALAQQDESLLSAIAARLIDLRKNADREAMGVLLEEARKQARKDLKRGESEESEPAAKKDDPTSKSLAAEEHALIDPKASDWLRYVLQAPAETQPYRDLVAVLGLSRTCVAIGTTASAREIINVYMYFGEMFRIDVERQLARMGDMALPALIEAQYHDSKMVRTWAKRRLDMMGRAIPSEAVRINDNQALADVLRAYGRAREVEAVRVIVSFANSDRLQVREAAREAIGQIGEPAQWQLRDAYEQLMGDKPARSWDWKRTAQELFAVYDRARLQEVYTTMDRGLELAKEGKPDQAIELFDRVLARAPMFERRGEMVPAYLAHARAVRDKDKAAAAAALRRALAIDPSGDQANAVRSELALIEVEELSASGVLDVTLLDRAIELDPSNDRARALRESLKVEVQLEESRWRRYAAAVAIGVVALAAMVFVALLPRRKKALDTSLPRLPRTPDAPPPPPPKQEELR
ncbi:MAG TPA: hypothetical protein PKL73_06930 [Polyangiaceae bacterium]|nr:hypothetical protein [Polyangiaceae bacterium]